MSTDSNVKEKNVNILGDDLELLNDSKEIDTSKDGFEKSSSQTDDFFDGENNFSFLFHQRKPDKTEVEEEFSPCPHCHQRVPDYDLLCSSCQLALPYCVITVSKTKKTSKRMTFCLFRALISFVKIFAFVRRVIFRRFTTNLFGKNKRRKTRFIFFVVVVLVNVLILMLLLLLCPIFILLLCS